MSREVETQGFWLWVSPATLGLLLPRIALVLLSLGLALLLSGCDQKADESPVRATTASGPAPPVAPVVVPLVPVSTCELLLDELRAEPQLSGTPLLDQHRAELLARARAVPLLFRRAPLEDPALTPRVREFRKLLRDAEFPGEAIYKILHKTRGRYAERRSVFLTESYLFAETPRLALRLSQIIRLDHLFAEPQVIIQRGNQLLVAERSEGRYFLPPNTGAEGEPKRAATKGPPAGILLFDRVSLPADSVGPSLHVDLTPIERALGFSAADVLAHTEDHLALALQTEGVRSLAVFRTSLVPLALKQAMLTRADPSEGNADPIEKIPALALVGDVVEQHSLSSARAVVHLELLCESVDPRHSTQDFEQARRNALVDQALIDPVLQAARQMIEQQLPFDEPRTEEGQQDGLLRLHFRQAYYRYRSTYEFNGDNYYVFDPSGRVRLPQVCIDFITDAFDWGTGGSWPRAGQKRLRKKGALHFADLGIENPRSIESLAQYATATPAWFDVIWFEKERQIKFLYREKFFRQLSADAHLYRPGDVVFIYGLRDDGKFHYHSFLIDEKDPITGMPILLMANAGPPQARSWEGEMQSAPLRSIVARMRVRREVLAQAYEQARRNPGRPLAPPPTDYQIPEKKPASAIQDELGLPAL